MKPHRLHLALLIGSAIVLAVALYVSRPRCTCVLGGADYFDSQTDAREDCAVHGKGKP